MGIAKLAHFGVVRAAELVHVLTSVEAGAFGAPGGVLRGGGAFIGLVALGDRVREDRAQLLLVRSWSPDLVRQLEGFHGLTFFS